jgi:hypothetical protein
MKYTLFFNRPCARVTDKPYARKIELAEFSIKKSGTKSYLENPKGKPGNPGV